MTYKGEENYIQWLDICNFHIHEINVIKSKYCLWTFSNKNRRKVVDEAVNELYNWHIKKV